DPTLPAVPAGAVKRFTVDVMQHVTQVAPDLAPTEAWTYVVNGREYRGTAASAPIVVEQGDRVKVTFVNGGSKAMGVTMPHSIDFHAAEVAPSRYYTDVAPGKRLTISFVAKHPGVFMYHCATQPVLTHTANLAPSQGGWVEFTLDQKGNFPFVTHAFGDMVRGAAGMLHTSGAPLPKAPAAAKATAPDGVGVTLGDMWIKSTTPSVKAGKVTFNVKNAGATMHGLSIVPA